MNHSGEKVVKTGWRATNSISSWSWEGCEGRPATVEVYADAARVELQLNGRTVGTAKAGRDADYLTKFVLPYEPGVLTAIAYGAGRRRDRTYTRSPARAAAFDWTCNRRRPNSSPTVRTWRTSRSSSPTRTGSCRPLADRSVTVTVEGAGTLQGLGSAEAITTEGFAATSHRTFNGRALAVVRSGHEPGEIRVVVTAEGAPATHVILQVLPHAATHRQPSDTYSSVGTPAGGGH